MVQIGCYTVLCTAGVLFCILFAPPVLTLRCYVCDSMESSDCGDRFRVLPSDASNCPSGSRCIKFRGFRGSGVVKSPEVHRYCSLEYDSNGCQSAYRNGIDGEACACTRDLCNTAAPISVTMVLLLCLTCLSWFCAS